MATKEIKHTIVLEGEKQYNAAIKEAKRNLQTLKSELEAETAELGKNATEQQKAEAKTKSLKAQIKEQEKIVKTLRDALKEAKEKYSDNSDVVAKWEIKLNNARATLGNMKSNLEGVDSGLKTMSTDAAAATVATKSVADALGSISSAGQSVSDAIEGIFTGLIDTAADAVGELWELISQTAARANNWTDLASYYGSTAVEMQKWGNSIKAAGGDFDKFLGIVNKLAFGGKEKKITELIGVNKENYEDDIKYTMAVLDELQQKKEKLGQGWYDSTMSELFGARKSADVSWFLSNMYGHEGATGDWIYGWRDGAARFNGDQTGYGMSTKELATMNDVWVKINEIATKWEALKESFAAGFGVAALDLMVNVSGTLDGIADYMNATDDAGREAALKKIRENVEQFFAKLGEIIRESIHILHDVGMELSESDDPLTAAIGDILVKLSEALQWMVDNQDAVKKAFEAIFGLWLLAKLVAVAGSLASILKQIEAIKAFKGLSATASGGSPSTSGTGTGTGGGSATSTGVKLGGLAGSGTTFSMMGGAATFVPIAALAAAGAAGAAMVNANLNDSQLNQIYGGQNGENNMLETMSEESWRKAWAYWTLYSDADKTGSEEAMEAREELVQALEENGFELSEQAASLLEKVFENYLQETDPDGLVDRIEQKYPGFFTKGGPFTADYDEEIMNPEPEFSEHEKLNAIQDWWDAWRNAMNEEDSWEEAEAAYDYMEKVLGDGMGEVMAAIHEHLKEVEDQNHLEDLPAEWWITTSNWSGQGRKNPDENGLSVEDLSGFMALPDGMESATERGVKKGISGLRLEIDGQAAGRILAPYVSMEIAKDIP